MNCNYKSAILKDFKLFMRQAGKPVINPQAHSYSENNKQRNNTTMKKSLLLAVAALVATGAYAQGVKIKGVYENMRNNDGDVNLISVGSIYEKDGQYALNKYGQTGWTYTNKYLFLPPQGIYSMTYDRNSSTLSAPVKEPSLNRADVVDASGNVDMDKANIAINYNLMVGNSGAGYVDGKILTVMSRDYQSTPDEELSELQVTLNELIDQAMQTANSSVRRLTLNIIERLILEEDDLRTDFLDFCFEHMVSIEEFPGIQTLCMKLAYRMCSFYPELMDELKRTLEAMEIEYYKPAIKCLRKRILSGRYK